jgi:hypothetical protein
MVKMTLKQYLRHKALEEVRRDAAEEGIEIVAERSKPRLVENVVSFSSSDEGLQQC